MNTHRSPAREALAAAFTAVTDIEKRLVESEAALERAQRNFDRADTIHSTYKGEVARQRANAAVHLEMNLAAGSAIQPSPGISIDPSQMFAAENDQAIAETALNSLRMKHDALEADWAQANIKLAAARLGLRPSLAATLANQIMEARYALREKEEMMLGLISFDLTIADLPSVQESLMHLTDPGELYPPPHGMQKLGSNGNHRLRIAEHATAAAVTLENMERDVIKQASSPPETIKQGRVLHSVSSGNGAAA